MIERIIFILVLCSLSVPSAWSQDLPVIALRDFLFADSVDDAGRQRFDKTILAEQLERALRDTRKFRVVSRDKAKLEAVLDEQDFSQSEASAGNGAAEGELLATNYIVIPTITEFSFYRWHRPVANIKGKFHRSDHGKLATSLEILDTSTGESKGTFDFSDSFGTEAEIVNGKGGSPAPSWLARMSRNISASFANQLIAAVFPMKIIAVQGNQIFINRGDDGGLKEGETLIVFRPGMALRDPDTGILLGSTEAEAGKVKVTDIKPKFSVATVLEGTIEELDILRRP